MRQSKGIQIVQTRVVESSVVGRLYAGIRQTLNRIPVLLRAQLAMLVAASFVCSAVVVLAGDRGVERQAFAVPAAMATQAPWSDEVGQFAKRLHKALGVPRATASEFS